MTITELAPQSDVVRLQVARTRRELLIPLADVVADHLEAVATAPIREQALEGEIDRVRTALHDLHANNGEGKCRECRKATPCPTIRTLTPWRWA